MMLVGIGLLVWAYAATKLWWPGPLLMLAWYAGGLLVIIEALR